MRYHLAIIFIGHIAKPGIDCIPTHCSVYFSTVGKSTFKQVKLAGASWRRPVWRQKGKKKHYIQPKTHFCLFFFFGQNILPVCNTAAGGRPYFKLLLVLHLQTPPPQPSEFSKHVLVCVQTQLTNNNHEVLCSEKYPVTIVLLLKCMRRNGGQ